jgi:fucose 4-O-acetylase-like acetyltransferase
MQGAEAMRDERIDLLRFVGLALIILAHVNPPDFILQIRNFDVPLMVIVSGLSFRASFKEVPYTSYVWERFKRLVLPTWLFLSLYFTFLSITDFPFHLPQWKTILSSYLLIEGIGYVWIIRVFLLVAVVAPFIYAYSKNQKSNQWYMLLIAIVYVFYELFLFVSQRLPQPFPINVFESIISYLTPYAVVFSVGIRLPDLSRKNLYYLGFVSFLVFSMWIYFNWILFGEILAISDSKFPAQSYYISYSLFVSVLVWMGSARVISFLKGTRLMSLILFIAQNSMWIYLWHIPFVAIINSPPFLLRYCLVFLAATLITSLQVNLVKQYLLPNMHNLSFKKNLRALLTG